MLIELSDGTINELSIVTKGYSRRNNDARVLGVKAKPASFADRLLSGLGLKQSAEKAAVKTDTGWNVTVPDGESEQVEKAAKLLMDTYQDLGSAMSIADEPTRAAAVVAAVQTFATNYEEVDKAGRRLSAATIAKMASMRETISTFQKQLDELEGVDEGEPVDKAEPTVAVTGAVVGQAADPSLTVIAAPLADVLSTSVQTPVGETRVISGVAPGLADQPVANIASTHIGDQASQAAAAAVESAMGRLEVIVNGLQTHVDESLQMTKAQIAADVDSRLKTVSEQVSTAKAASDTLGATVAAMVGSARQPTASGGIATMNIEGGSDGAAPLGVAKAAQSERPSWASQSPLAASIAAIAAGASVADAVAANK